MLRARRRRRPRLSVVLQLLREAQRVHGVDQPRDLDRLLHLVALERADHVPAHGRHRTAALGATRVELVDERGALNQLLHAVLAEIHMAEGDKLADVLDRRVLGHGDEHDVALAAAAPLGGAGHARTDIVVALAQRARQRGVRIGGDRLRLRGCGLGHARHRAAGSVATVRAAHKRRGA